MEARLSDGRYIILYHDNPGGTQYGGFNDATPREPLYLSLREFRPEADQPVWFSPPKHFMATEGVGVDDVKRSLGDGKSGSLSQYSSFTSRAGEDGLWYPDSIVFLLGKKVSEDFLSDLVVTQYH